MPPASPKPMIAMVLNASAPMSPSSARGSGRFASRRLAPEILEDHLGEAGDHGEIVVAVDAPHFLRKRAAHHQPHDLLDAVGAALLHELLVGHARELLGIALDEVEELRVPRDVV